MKILYLSCHSILEFDEVSLLHELGHQVFSPGAYVEPANPGDASLRPGISGLNYDQSIIKQYSKIGAMHPGEDAKNYLTKEFVDNFDCIIVMHLPRWILHNWHVMKHKRVIWRTIGQSISNVERAILSARMQGLEIVRYSPKEVTIPGYIGEDAIIRFYKNPDEYGPWNGNHNRVITFAQSMKQRDQACNFTLFERVTRPFDRHLFGPGNEGLSFSTGRVSFSQLQEEMRNNRVYFYTGTHPASYTLNFMEAFISGIPVVAIGKKFGNARYFPDHDLYEIPDFISNEINGFISDDEIELQKYIRILLNDKDIASKISHEGRNKAIELFGKDKIMKQWQEYLNRR